ncbi:MAG: sigma-54 dependent transcriptional regulator [Fimbriimonadaceae bacterium]|nr:sigma-54 dependent transcriptional regulator [Fimbriimonadaceae bacterium]
MSEQKRVLVVDDEPNIRRILQAALEKVGIKATVAEDGHAALSQLAQTDFDCVLTDVTMPGISGYELLNQIKSRNADLPVVIMTAYGTIPQAVQAIRDGAFEYVTKPFDLDNLKKIVASAMEPTASNKAPKTAKRTGKAAGPAFIGESEPMKEVGETIRQVADSRATVLITGESGTGKEVVAKLLHTLSPRASHPFVAVSCAALPETLLESELFGYEKGAFTGAQGSKIGRFEAAQGGTLFLDEIGEIPMATQVKLLRVLQEREFERLGATKPTKVDVRLVTATNRELQQAVDDGVFRLDLMYRLQVIEIRLPPLRERGEDIRLLGEFFLRRSSADNGRHLDRIGDEAFHLMSSYSWPGNVRELENTMERAVILAGKDEQVLLPRHLPPNILKFAA